MVIKINSLELSVTRQHNLVMQLQLAILLRQGSTADARWQPIAIKPTAVTNQRDPFFKANLAKLQLGQDTLQAYFLMAKPAK